jgi:signal transduction histidine kinase
MRDDLIGPQVRRLLDDLGLAVTVREVGQPGYLYMSDACEELLGRPRAQWPDEGDVLAACSHPEDRAAITEAQRLGPDGPSPSTVDWRLIGPGGAVSQIRTRWAWVNLSLRPCLVGLSQEVPTAPPATDQRPPNDEEERLAQLSHDLRTPLNAVLGFAQLLALSELNDQQRDELEEIARAGRRLLALIDAFAAAGP